MPSFPIVLEDTSPMLVYSANWRAVSSESDAAADQHSQSSATSTQTKGSSMSFSFYGSSVQLVGSRAHNHGPYAVQVNGNPSAPFNGQSDTPQFDQVTFNTTLATGVHNLTLTNGDNTIFDIDHVTFQTSVGQDNEGLIVNTYQDNNPSFTFTPPSSWNTPDNVGTFSGSSGHLTTQPSAAATFTFEVRDAVQLFGPVGPNSTAAYSVQMDNRSPSFFSANKQFYRPQQVLFYAGNLGPGKHSLQIQLGSPATGEFAVDYANVFTAPSLGGSFLAMTADASTSRALPIGVLAGLAITTTLAAFASLLSIYLFWRQRYDLLHYAPRPNPKVPVEDLKFVRPFVVASDTERNIGLPRGPAVGNSQANNSRASRGPVRTSSLSGYSQGLSSAYSVAPESTVPAMPSSADPYSVAATSVYAARVPNSRSIQEDARPRRPARLPEKGGLHLTVAQQLDDESSPSSPYDDEERPSHPPPEYSRNPNRRTMQR
ncbi:hypothetical protein GALMADRAFT_226648 [Galerina marginata CBS 339.88]|uniref:Transmembrane protein n=1 Tax=Galerina marginata (strain CBS 339.88) TaxID=685588 RepID=A0A067SVR1_GALM3|nr:hypothetical protein GALMADRAFT_226648 [Galerina marginata CBS 339.88]